MKKIFAILSAALLAAPIYAQTYSALLESADAQSFAVANASIARPAGIHAAGTNAAAMSLSENKFAAGAAFSMWAPKTANSKIAGLGAWGKINDKLAIGLDARYIMGQAYDVVNDLGYVSSTFSPNDIHATAAVSYKIIDCLSVGVGAKFVSSKLEENVSAMAFGADVSVAFNRNGLSAALAACNLGSSLTYGKSKPVALPAMVKAGVAYNIVGLTASAEADYLFDGAFMAGLGLEYSIKDIAFIRAGYHYGDQKKALVSFASVGLGVKFFGVELNACYLLASEALANTMMFGLGYSF